MTGPETTTCDANLPAIPDLRQSICHTLMAAGFVILNLQNPFVSGGLERSFHTWMMVALAVAVVFSWYFFYRRLRAWRSVPQEVRARVTRRPRDLRQRAVSHLLMSLLAMMLTALGYLGRLAIFTEEDGALLDRLILAFGGVVGVLAVAIFARTVRDIMATRRAAD